MKKFFSLATLLLLSGMGLAQIPDSTKLTSEPISLSNPVLQIPFVTANRGYNPFYMNSMEFREPFGLRVKGGGFNSHRFLLNGIPVNNRLYNDIPLTDGSITLDKGWLSGRTPGQSSGVFVITQPLPGKTISSAIEVSGGTYYSSDNGLHPQRTKLDNLGNKNLSYSASGPVPFVENLSFSTGGMFSQDGGYLSGKSVYKTWEGSSGSSGRIKPSGDSSDVLMNDFNRRSLSFRLLWNTDFISTDFFVLYSRKTASYYSFDWLLTPDGNLRHFQEQIISGLTTQLSWSESFSQKINLSYQPTQTWGYLAPDVSNLEYVRELPSGGLDPDLFFSKSGGYDNRRYRYQDNLFLFSVENNYTWNDTQKSFLTLQTENWWYFEEKGRVYNREYNAIPPEMYLFGYSINRHPALYSVTGGHQILFTLLGQLAVAEAGIRVESFLSDGETYRDDPAYSGNDLGHFLTGKKAKPTTEFLPYFSGKVGLNEPFLLSWSINQSVDWPSYDNLYWGEYPELVGERNYIGNPEMGPEKWTTAQLGMEWNPLPTFSLSVDGYLRSSQKLISADYKYEISGLYTLVSSNKTEVSYRGISVGIRLVPELTENLVFRSVSFSSFLDIQDYDYKFHPNDFLDSNLKEENYWTTPMILKLNIDFETFWNMNGHISYYLQSGNYYFTNYFIYDGGGRPISISDTREQMPTISQINLNLEQKLPIELVESSVFVSVENLFDKRNLLTVYPQTGKADLKGDENFNNRFTNEPLAHTYRKTGAENPDFYTPPRKITAGIRVKF
ncbi:MAG: hypothetical protein LCH54_00815 [Bacteroidetes bacterium]|nr:hypothetical protein [Bacteroidota bacterium]